MTKAQILDLIIEKKEIELKEVKNIFKEVDTKRKDAYFGILQEYFGGEFSCDDVYIKKDNYGTSYEIVRPHSDYSYDKELLTIRLRDDWKTGEFTNFETSMYSTNDNSEWELERLITAGEVAKVILDHGDDMIAKFNLYKESFREEYTKALKDVHKIESDISSLKQEKNQSYLDIAKELLEGEGLEFSGNKKGSIDLRWDWTRTGITKARIVKKTASGKSADIELQLWDNEPQVYEKVRMSNIENLLWQYRDYVLTAQ